ncbi:MAG: DUF6544 family protein [Chloroflexota bacterium]
MGSSRSAGRIALGLGLGLGLGGLGALARLKARDDRYVNAIWQELEQSGGTAEPFSETMVAGLPEPARRYFLHAIRPGTPLATRLHWHYTGGIRTAATLPWLSMQAEQIVAKQRGFVWKARASLGPVVATGADYYLDGESHIRIALFGLWPLVDAGGPDIGRSAMARLLVESVALPPALLPGPQVRIEAVDDAHFTARLTLQGEETPLTVRVDQEGRVEELVMQRWGNYTDDRSFRYIPYGGTVGGEMAFGGYTIPSQLSIGWWYGTKRYLEVIRLNVDWALLW